LFTASRVDILDNGSLKTQYHRNRYYDYYTGRCLTHDPLGYIDGMNFYSYLGNQPINLTDSLGLIGCSGSTCGIVAAVEAASALDPHTFADSITGITWNHLVALLVGADFADERVGY
jgi:RHS repeat-associated protein